MGPDGRKIGRNRDADMISTSADAYLAQLKRDSTTRNLARYAGDDIKANEIFHDPTIQDIQAPVNPYRLKEQNNSMLLETTVPEEMLIFQEYDDDDYDDDEEQPAAPSYVSYKEKMAQVQAKRAADRND